MRTAPLVVILGGLSTTAVAATLAAASLTSGCACPLVYVAPGASLTFATGVPGHYRFEVDAWGETVVVEADWGSGVCTGGGLVERGRLRVEPCGGWSGLSLLVTNTDLDTGPRALTVRVFRDGELRLTAQPQLTYHSADRGGIACGGDVEQADAMIVLP